MQRFLSFVLKEFRHILRDPRTMLILLGMPVMQIILFGFAISTEVKHTTVAVLTTSADHLTRRMVREIDASEYFTVVREAHTRQEVDELFRRGNISLALVFSPRFASSVMHGKGAAVQIIADASEPNQAQITIGYIRQLLTAALDQNTPAPLSVNTRLLYNPQARSAYNFVPGVMGMILLLICAMMTSVSIVREKETGTMEVLLASPVSPMSVIIAKMVPYFVLSCVNLTTILLLSRFVLDVPINGSLALLLGLSMLYVMLSLSLGLLISSLVRTQMAAVLTSGMGLILPTVILSGLMFPVESMPHILQWISAITPARWYIAAVRKVMIQGVTLPYVAQETVILAGMTLVLVITSVKRFKIRLE